MNDGPLFDRMGNVYCLLVDEDKRRAKERDFLLDVARSARRRTDGRMRRVSATRVLDLACGTGLHGRLLAEAGYPVTGIDASESILAEAERLTPRALRVDYRLGDVLDPIALPRPAALTLVLGNTLSLFANDAELRKALRNAAQATGERGLVLTQTLNYARFAKAESQTTARHGRIEGRETVLTKTLQRLDDGRILLTLCAAQPGPTGKWETVSECSILRPLSAGEIEKAARRAGLRVEARFGAMSREPFDPETSADCVLLFRRDGLPGPAK